MHFDHYFDAKSVEVNYAIICFFTSKSQFIRQYYEASSCILHVSYSRFMILFLALLTYKAQFPVIRKVGPQWLCNRV